MEEIKEKLLPFLTKFKDVAWEIFVSHKKKIILALALILILMAGVFALNQIEVGKKENASVVTVNLLEGQSFAFSEPISSYNLDDKYSEFLEVNLDDQKIYALNSYAEGKIEFLAKLKSGGYNKYEVVVAAFDVEMVQKINIPRNGTALARNWSSGYSASWTSTNAQIATVDQEGNITGVGLGECDVIAQISEEIAVTYHVAVIDVALSPSAPFIYVGESLTYELLGLDATESENFKLESDNDSVATVRGMTVRGITEGTANISLSLNKNIYSSTLTVMGQPSIDDISLTVNTTVDVVAKNLPNFEDCEEIKVANEEIATFENGKVTGLKIGSTMATVKIKDREFSFNIDVTGASLVPQENLIYDETFNKFNHYENLFKYSVEEGDSIKIYFTNTNTQVPSAKTQDDNFRIFEVTGEYVEITGTNPGVGLLAIDFDDHRIYAEVHVQYANAHSTQREWEVSLKNFTDSLRKDGDWIYAEETHASYFDAKNDISRKVNGISFVNYALQDIELFSMENHLSIGEDGKITGDKETMQLVGKYFESIEFSSSMDVAALQLGDIVIWTDGSASIFMGTNNGGTLTWYEAHPDLAEADGFFARFYSENNKEELEIVQVLRLHYVV